MGSSVIVSSNYFASKLKEFEDDLSKIESIDLTRNSLSLVCEEYWIDVHVEPTLKDKVVMVSYMMDGINFKRVLRLLESIEDQPITLFFSQNTLSIKLDYF